MAMIDSLLLELEQEACSTRRMLERVPDDKLGWKPHEKSRTLGELASHIASTQKHVATFLQKPSHEAGRNPEPPPADTASLLAEFDSNLAETKALLGSMTDENLMSEWSLTANGQPVFTMPKAGVVRKIILNHVYHHRGQLSVYLRELGVALPVVYGPTADENPFM